MKRSIRFIGVFSMVFLWSGNAVAATVSDCDPVSGNGVFAGGVSFDGTASDVDGIHMIDWMHTTDDFVFDALETNPDGGIDDGLVCRRNGLISASFQGDGLGTVNGVPGFSYQIDIQDNRPAPDSLVLVASITRHPTRRNEGIADFTPPRTVVVPAEIDVVVGASGSGWLKLHLDAITCRYRGTGTTYGFVRCTDPLDSGYVAGDRIDTSHARLRIQQADRSFELTSVEADIGVLTPQPGLAYTYHLIISGPGGFFYNFSTSVIDGDIAINLVP